MRIKTVTIRQWMSLLHGWIGGLSAIFILCIGVTGVGLAYFGELAELQYGDMLTASQKPQTATAGEMFDAAEGHIEDFQAMGLFMPDTRMENIETAFVWGFVPNASSTTAVPSMDVYLASIDPNTGAYLGSFDLHDMFAHEFNDFHFNLLAGPIGAIFIAIIGLLLVAFALSGIYMWWPRSRSKKGTILNKLTTIKLRGRWHGKWINWHGFAGIWLGILIMYYALTGVGLSQSDWFGPLLSQVEDPPAYENLFRDKDCGDIITIDDAVQQAHDIFPKHALTQITRVNQEQFKYVINLRKAGDMNARFGDAQVQVHAKCHGIVWHNELSDNDLPTIVGSQMLSLHGAHFLPGVWPAIVTTITALALILMSVSGLYLFVKRTLPNTKALITRT